MFNRQILRYLIDIFPNKIKKIYIRNKIIFIELNNNSDIDKFCFFLKNHSIFLFKNLIDIFGVDFRFSKSYFNIYYNLVSNIYNYRIFLIINVLELSFTKSIFKLYKSANWVEREIYDFFGIFFLNHPDLRRILTDYGFNGFPLRKDFPLIGFFELRYDESEKCILYENIELSQEYRIFDFSTPWIKKKN
jgi:NADH:ubiquinone oxidoreductase subunit C